MMRALSLRKSKVTSLSLSLSFFLFVYFFLSLFWLLFFNSLSLVFIFQFFLFLSYNNSISVSILFSVCFILWFSLFVMLCPFLYLYSRYSFFYICDLSVSLENFSVYKFLFYKKFYLFFSVRLNPFFFLSFWTSAATQLKDTPSIFSHSHCHQHNHSNYIITIICKGCHNSSVDLSAPSILPLRDRVRSTPSMLSPVYLVV